MPEPSNANDQLLADAAARAQAVGEGLLAGSTGASSDRGQIPAGGQPGAGNGGGQAGGQPGASNSGKYANAEERDRGIHELIQYNKQVLAQNEHLSARVRELEGNRRPSPEQRAEKRATELLEENDAVPRARFVPAVREVLAEYFAPVFAAAQADQQMSGEIQGYAENIPAFHRFMETDPKVAPLVREANEKGAFLLGRQYAYHEFLRSLDANGQQAADQRRQQAEEARGDAAILGSGRTEQRQQAINPQLRANDLVAMIQNAQDTGDMSQIEKRLVRGLLPSDEFFQRLGQNL